MTKWKKAKFTAGKYEVSNEGQVRDERGKEISQTIDEEGHPTVSIHYRGARGPKRVAQLVMENFGQPAQPRQMMIHVDGDPTNCAKSNLRWKTPKELRKKPGPLPGERPEVCPRGHQLVKPNLVSGKPGSEACKACSTTAAEFRESQGYTGYVSRRSDKFVRVANAKYRRIMKL